MENGKDLPDYNDDYEEGQPLESCPRCSRSYDDIDYDYQSCSKCGWDAEKEEYSPAIKRPPYNDDYMSGDADIITGRWI